MSHWIEYQAACFVIPADALRLPEPRYVIAIEGGSNNLTSRERSGRERRVRDWYVGMLGTADQVMQQTVRAAAGCIGGNVKLCSRRVTPEAYIQRTRRLLRKPSDGVFRHVTLSARVAPDSPLVALAEACDMITWHGDECGRPYVKLIPRLQDSEGWATYFSVVESILDSDTVVFDGMGEVFGLPRS